MKIEKCRIFFSTLFILTSFSVHSQKRYFVDEYTYYQLNDSIHFTFGQTGFCGSAPSGKGTYKKTGNKITFQFSPSPSAPQIVLNEYPVGNNSSTHFKLKIICLEDSINSLPFVNLYYLDTLNKKIGNYADIDGVCELEIKKNNFQDTIFINYPGIPKMKIPILPFDQTIEILLPLESPFEIHDVLKSYRVGRKNKLIPLEN